MVFINTHGDRFIETHFCPGDVVIPGSSLRILRGVVALRMFRFLSLGEFYDLTGFEPGYSHYPHPARLLTGDGRECVEFRLHVALKRGKSFVEQLHCALLRHDPACAGLRLVRLHHFSRRFVFRSPSESTRPAP